MTAASPSAAPLEVGPEFLAPPVVGVRVDGRHGVLVDFAGGRRARVEVGPLLDRGVFRALRDGKAFAAVSVVPGGGGIAWASGADLSATRLYRSGQAVE